MLTHLVQSFFSKQAAVEPGTEPDPQALQVATCVLLLEVACVDDEFGQDERDHIVGTLRSRFTLSDEDATELIEAAHDTRDASYDLWKFTHEVNKACTPEEKIRIIEEIWRVIYADGTLDAHEDYLVHKLAKLLNLDHRQLITAKVKVRNETQAAH